MSRIITRTAHGPAKVTTKSGDEVWVCRCGLSKNEDGTCDKSHKKTLDEKEDEVYCYDESGERYVVQKMGEQKESCCGSNDCCGDGQNEKCCGGDGACCSGGDEGCCCQKD